jgi:glycosyltransferase involved in cell wall biosynthesis
VAIAVHGRFHAFDLARALLARGHDVRVLTNYPRAVLPRFGLEARRARSFPLHGVLARIAGRARAVGLGALYPEAWLHQLFGRWAAATLARERWDVVVCFSGVAEETLRWLDGSGALRMVLRGSAHIRTQARLLEEEERRTGVRLDRPSSWMIAREEREYALTDRIVVLSSFARDSFVAEGVPPERLVIVPPGADLDRFRAVPATVEARCRRMVAGERLRVLNVGAFSLRKGMWDLAAAIEEVDPARFEFRFVGTVTAEARALARRLRHAATFDGHRPEAALPDVYGWGDVFALPTVEDGFGLVLLQAAAAGLPIVTTPHGGGRDLVRDGVTGWLCPVRSPESLVKRLRWCDENRPALAWMTRELGGAPLRWGWERTTAAFERACEVAA